MRTLLLVLPLLARATPAQDLHLVGATSGAPARIVFGDAETGASLTASCGAGTSTSRASPSVRFFSPAERSSSSELSVKAYFKDMATTCSEIPDLATPCATALADYPRMFFCVWNAGDATEVVSDPMAASVISDGVGLYAALNCTLTLSGSITTGAMVLLAAT